MSLLERAEQVAAIVERFDELDRHGHLVLISGEAGAGKSVLVQELLDQHLGDAEVLVGRCDDLFAPRPLGPLADIARHRPGPLAMALAAGDPATAFDAFLAEVSQPGATVVVLEDLQWADEATLDLVRFVARRLEDVACLILATHRDDLAPDHPMRLAIGSLVGPQVSRVHLPPLSLDAVRTLVGDRLVDPVALHASTGGNAFFVTESLAVEPGAMPPTVRDVVLARAAPLTGPARDALDAAAVLGRDVSPELIEEVGDCDSRAIEECLRAGLLVDADGRQSFRHDLTRQAVEESMTPLRRRQLHTRALAALGEEGDLVERAHHAVGADDRDAIADLAARAADHCVALGAWRQAAVLYGQAVAHSEQLPEDERRRLLAARTTTCLRVELVEEAVEAGEAAYPLIEAAGDEAATAEFEGELSRAYRSVGRSADAWAMCQRAVDRMEALGDSPGLAEALASLSGHELVTGHYTECIATSRRAIELGERFELEPTVAYALNSLGAALGSVGEGEAGVAALEESLDRSKRAALPDHVSRACSNLAFTLMVATEPARALPVLDEGIRNAREHELHYQLNCIYPSRAEVHMFLGDWDRAASDLTRVLADPYAADINRAIVFTILGRLQARRGDREAVATLDRGLDFVLRHDETQLIAPMRLARAEHAWLAGEPERGAREVEATLPMVPLLDIVGIRDLLLWARRTGVAFEPDDTGDEPTRLILAEDHRALAAWYEARHCVYEAADALGASDDLDDLRSAHQQLTELGAVPRARQVAHRLRKLGARDVPRGPRASTRANAAGLTKRELEVAALLADGLTNAGIADQLVLSQKTVDHHVSAVLSKLGVSSRRDVARAATDAGVDLAQAASGSL